MKIIYLINLLNLGISICNAHMFMSNPPSRRNKYSQYYVSNNLVDYNIMAPLNVVPYVFPCKGYTKGPSTAIINGNSVSVTLEGTAIHGGGHCQFGISYNDRDFLVLKTVLYTCLLDSLTYTIDLPSNTPSGEVTVFWTWINKIGNREYYMECADVTIDNGNKAGGIIKGKELLVVNLPGYSIIPEWGSSTDPSITGEKLLAERKDFSIVADKITTGTTTSNTETTMTSDTETTATTTSATETTTTIMDTKMNDTKAKNINDGCINGEMRCVNSGFETCVNNIWVYRDCGVGTCCKRYLSNYIICDFIKN